MAGLAPIARRKRLAAGGRPRPRRWRAARLAGLALLYAALPPSSAAQPTPNELQVKAALVYNFAKFVEWPDDAVSPPARMAVGVLDDSDLKSVIDETLRGKAVRGRGFEVQNLAGPQDAAAFHILVIASNNKDRVQQALQFARASPTLTIGELEGFIELGGVIGLVLENNQFRFEINAGTARRRGLKVSSRLLRLARAVKGN